jgi:hypothetical protein
MPSTSTIYTLPSTIPLTEGTGQAETYRLESYTTMKIADSSVFTTSQNGDQLTLKWFSQSTSLIYKIRISVPAYLYLGYTDYRTIHWKLYVDGSFQDEGEAKAAGTRESWFYIEDPYINWSRTVDINTILSSSDRTLPIELEIYDADTDADTTEYLATYSANITFPVVFVDLNFIDIDASESLVTLGQGEGSDNKQTVTLTHPSMYDINASLRYKSSGTTIEGTIPRTSVSNNTTKRSVTLYHDEKEELYMNNEVDAIQCAVSLVGDLDPDYSYYMLSNRTVYRDIYSVQVDPEYLPQELTIVSNEMRHESGHVYAGEWGYIQNVSYNLSSLEFLIPATRTGDIYLKLYENDTIAGTATISSSTVQSFDLTDDGYFRKANTSIQFKLTNSGDRTFRFDITDLGNIARKGTTINTSMDITVVPYSTPVIKSFEVYRATRDGSAGNVEEQVDSTNIAFTAVWEIASINNHNTTKVRQIECKQGTTSDDIVHTISSSYINNGTQTYYTSYTFSGEYTYPMTLTITDALDYTAAYTVNLPPASVFLDFKAGGKGMGIGKVAEYEELGVQFPTTFYDKVTYKGDIDASDNAVSAKTVSSTTETTKTLTATSASITSGTVGGATFNSDKSESHTGTETHSGATTFKGDVTFTGSVSGLPSSACAVVDTGYKILGSYYYVYYKVYDIGMSDAYLMDMFAYYKNTLSGSETESFNLKGPLAYSNWSAYGDSSSYPPIINVDGWYGGSSSPMTTTSTVALTALDPVNYLVSVKNTTTKSATYALCMHMGCLVSK